MRYEASPAGSLESRKQSAGTRGKIEDFGGKRYYFLSSVSLVNKNIYLCNLQQLVPQTFNLLASNKHASLRILRTYSGCSATIRLELEAD